MTDTKKPLPKIKRKYASSLRQLAFGGEVAEEALVEESVYDSQGNLLEFRKWEDGGCEINRYCYDDNGRVVSHEMEMDQEEAYEKWAYVRDDKGRVVKETKFYGDDEGERVEYVFERFETPVSITRYDSDGALEFEERLEYDANGDLISHVKTDAMRQIIERSEISYASKGLPTSKSVFESGNDLVSSTEITYDEQGRIIRVMERNGSGSLISDLQTQYDERGNVVMRKIRDFNPRLLRFEYDDSDRVVTEEILDENGNLIMRNTMEYDLDGMLSSETEFWLDVGRGTSHKNTVSRFEYAFHD